MRKTLIRSLGSRVPITRCGQQATPQIYPDLIPHYIPHCVNPQACQWMNSGKLDRKQSCPKLSKSENDTVSYGAVQRMNPPDVFVTAFTRF